MLPSVAPRFGRGRVVVKLILRAGEAFPANAVDGIHEVRFSAVQIRDRKARLAAMEHHLSDLEGRPRLDEAQGESHTFAAVLERFSSRD